MNLLYQSLSPHSYQDTTIITAFPNPYNVSWRHGWVGGYTSEGGPHEDCQGQITFSPSLIPLLPPSSLSLLLLLMPGRYMSAIYSFLQTAGCLSFLSSTPETERGALCFSSRMHLYLLCRAARETKVFECI